MRANQPHAVITGAGMAGAHTAKLLLEDGWRITFVDRQVPGDYLRDVLGDHPDVAVIQADLTDVPGTETALAGLYPDVVIHSAALIAARAQRDISETIEVNIAATLRLAQWAVAAGVKRFVAFSSWSVFSTSQAGPITAGSPLETRFSSYYIAGKLAMEHLLSAYSATSGLEVAVLRPAVLYGYGPNLGGAVGSAVIEEQVLHALRGEPARIPSNIISKTELVYAGDVAAAAFGAATRPLPHPFTWYVVGSQETTTIEELVETIRDTFPGADVGIEAGADSSVIPPVQEQPTDVTETMRVLGVPAPLKRAAGFSRFAEDLRQAASLSIGRTTA